MGRNKLQNNIIISATIIAIGILLLSLSYRQALGNFKNAISMILTPLQINVYSLVEPLFVNEPNAPEELIALAGEENILLDWDYDISETDYPVKVYVSEIIDNGDGNVTLGLNMVNEVGISGWQFIISINKRI